MSRMKALLLVLASTLAVAFAGCGGAGQVTSGAAAGSAPSSSDTTPPSAPGNFTATAAGSTGANLSWNPSTDNVGVAGYIVYRNGPQVGTSTTTSYADNTLSPSTTYTYTVAARDAAGNISLKSTPASATTAAGGPPPPPPPGAQDFPTRCAQPGVIKCVGFDSPSDIAGGYGDNSGIINSGTAAPVLDTTIFASGTSSLKMTIPSLSPADTSGSYFTNFSTDLLTQFGANSTFYVQWRQRFSPEFLNTFFNGGGGWKQAIIGAGDKPGCTASTSASGLCTSSCGALETVTQNTFQRGFPQMYNSCTGSTSHGAYYPFEQPYASSDFLLQNARPSPFCLYSQVNAGTQFPPTGNCFGYFPNEWMTFQVQITTGPRLATGAQDEWTNSVVNLWVARQGQASQPVFNFPINLSAGAPTDDLKFGKIWLLPYDTGKDQTQTYLTAYTWYDELIISNNPIADPP